MSLTDVMDDIDYANFNFNLNEAESRHPLWMTESHFVYHLYRDDDGHLHSKIDVNGEPICSPRGLSLLCMNKLVNDPGRIVTLRCHEIPADLYPCLLTEAIFQRELYTIDFLICTWPFAVLDLQSVIPREDLVEAHLLSNPLESHGELTILDCIMYGLLRQKPSSKMKIINFVGFKHEMKLCRELFRLPILWMKPEDRKVDTIFDMISPILDISKDKVQRYLNRISCIYSEMDGNINHGNQFSPITIILDCRVTLDDVPIGLALQNFTPFRFACQRIWIEKLPEVALPVTKINQVLDVRDITHIDIEDPTVCREEESFASLLEGISQLPNLRALGLPTSIHVEGMEDIPLRLNSSLQQASKLTKINFSGCNLRDNLHLILNGLTQNITCLCLRDSRLSSTDLQFLLKWNKLSGLIDLNLSRNDFKTEAQLCQEIVESIPNLTCLSLSYCSFTIFDIKRLVEKCIKCQSLKTLAIQSFTPLPTEDSRAILRNVCTIESIQKCLIIPEAFAFPGSNEVEWHENRERMIEICTGFLTEYDRVDIHLE